VSVRQALLEGGVPELVDRACLTEDLPGRGVLEQAGERGPRARLEEEHGMDEDHQRRPARDRPRQQLGWAPAATGPKPAFISGGVC
jgi:hypothetical protein